MVRAASGCRWNETSAGDDQRQTKNDSRQQNAREQHQRATDARAPPSLTRLAGELAASAAAVHQCDVVTTTGACDQTSGSVVHRLKALK